MIIREENENKKGRSEKENNIEIKELLYIKAGIQRVREGTRGGREGKE